MDAWNERSGRYVKDPEKLEFYVPSKLRRQSKDSKQASDEVFEYTEEENEVIFAKIKEAYAKSLIVYEELVKEHNLAGELARIVLPDSAKFTSWRWTASLQSVLHFLTERLDSHAQWEIRQYAHAVYVLVEPVVSNVLQMITDERKKEAEAFVNLCDNPSSAPLTQSVSIVGSKQTETATFDESQKD